ncbi:MAG: hypothetical protein ACREFQ_04620, partial [Stellaceae bacterium]
MVARAVATARAPAPAGKESSDVVVLRPRKRSQPSLRPVVNPRIARYLASEMPPTPCLVIDLDLVAQNYRELA